MLLAATATAFMVSAVLATHHEPVRTEPTVRLSYAREDAAASQCPDEATFRTLVVARLGYDPFDRAGSLVLRIDLRPRGGEIVGDLVLLGEAGEERVERTLRDADCFELASSLALATALAVGVDPSPSGVVPTPATPLPSEATPREDHPTSSPEHHPTTTPAPKDDPPSLWRPTRPRARLTLAIVTPVGLTPASRGGVRVGAGADGGVWSIVAEGVVFFPSSHSESFGTVTSFVAHGSLVPCGHLPVHRIVRVDLCAVGSLGAMFSDADEVTRSDPQTHLFATVGPRAGVTVMPRPRIGVAAVFDVPVNLARTHLMIADQGVPREAWVASRVGFVAGLALVLALP